MGSISIIKEELTIYYSTIDETYNGVKMGKKSNDYIDGEVFKIKPSAVTNNKTGKEVYDSLVAQSYYKLKKYNYEKTIYKQSLKNVIPIRQNLMGRSGGATVFIARRVILEFLTISNKIY